MDGLEAHIVADFDKWDGGRLYLEKKERYSDPMVYFSPRVKISYGELDDVTIHVGNPTEYYFEEGRFKPTQIRVIARPNLKKDESRPGHCNHVDFFTDVLYHHPDGRWFFDNRYFRHRVYEESPDIAVPFDYEVRSLLDIPKANKLLKRNHEVLQEISDRYASLSRSKALLESKGIVLPESCE